MSEPYLTSSKLSAIKGLKHGFFKRQTAENYDEIAKLWGLSSSDDVLSLHQIHSDVLIPVRAPFPRADQLKADGMLTAKPKVALAIRTADCGPILMASRCGRLVAAIHAGWRGALAGILDRAIDAFGENKIEPHNIIAAIGPMIAQKSYEVGTDVFKEFYEQSPQNEHFFKDARRPHHYLFDLPGYIAFRLKNAGLQDIDLMDIDTYEHDGQFFSYRRARHQEALPTGRQISVIMIDQNQTA